MGTIKIDLEIIENPNPYSYTIFKIFRRDNGMIYDMQRKSVEGFGNLLMEIFALYRKHGKVLRLIKVPEHIPYKLPLPIAEQRKIKWRSDRVCDYCLDVEDHQNCNRCSINEEGDICHFRGRTFCIPSKRGTTMNYRGHDIPAPCLCCGATDSERIDDLISERIADIEKVYKIKLSNKPCACPDANETEHFDAEQCDCGTKTAHDHCLKCGGVIG